MNKLFQDLKRMAVCPDSFAKSVFAEENMNFFSRPFLMPAIMFLMYSLLAALELLFVPPEFFGVISGVPMSLSSPVYVILIVSILGNAFTTFAVSSLLSVYLPYIGNGRLAFRLALLFVIIPALYALLSLMPLPLSASIIISVAAFMALFVPVFKKKHTFLSMLYCFFMFSSLLLIFEILQFLPIFANLPKLYLALQMLSAAVSLVYSVAFIKGVSGLSSAKSFAAFISAGILVMVFLWSLQISGIISPEISQILSLS